MHCRGRWASGDSRQDISALEEDFLSDAESVNVKEWARMGEGEAEEMNLQQTGWINVAAVLLCRCY